MEPGGAEETERGLKYELGGVNIHRSKKVGLECSVEFQATAMVTLVTLGVKKIEATPPQGPWVKGFVLGSELILTKDDNRRMVQQDPRLPPPSAKKIRS